MSRAINYSGTISIYQVSGKCKANLSGKCYFESHQLLELRLNGELKNRSNGASNYDFGYDVDLYSKKPFSQGRLPLQGRSAQE